MSTPQFLQWLDDKMEKFGQGKLIPPESILAEELNDKVRDMLAQDIKDRILKEQDADGQIERAFEKLQPVIDEKGKKLTANVTEDLSKEPAHSWRDPVHELAEEICDERP